MRVQTGLVKCSLVFVVSNWDLYQKLLDHLLSRHIKTTADQHPIMMTEPPVGMSGGPL